MIAILKVPREGAGGQVEVATEGDLVIAQAAIVDFDRGAGAGKRGWFNDLRRDAQKLSKACGISSACGNGPILQGGADLTGHYSVANHGRDGGLDRFGFVGGKALSHGRHRTGGGRLTPGGTCRRGAVITGTV